MRKFSPQPWRVNTGTDVGTDYHYVVDAENVTVAYIGITSANGNKEIIANHARLIAEAPTMHNLLTQALDLLTVNRALTPQTGEETLQVIDEIQALLARVEG